MEGTTIKTWRYIIPANCYRATDWCGSECTSGGLTILAEAKMIRFHDPKKNETLKFSITPETIYKVEDSSRYFVFLGEGKATGFGFKSRNESKLFIDSIKDIIPQASLNIYMRRDKDKIKSILLKQLDDIKAQEEQLITEKSDNVDSTEGIEVRTTRASYAPLPEKPLSIKTESSSNENGITSSSSSSSSITVSSTVINNDNGTNSTVIQKDETNEKKDEQKDESDQQQQEEQQQQEQQQQQTNHRKHFNEDFTQEKWRKHKKHMFMLSIAGKPIYSRYGDEQQLSPFTATLSALLSFVVDAGDDTLRYFVAGEHQFVFYVHGPVALVCICATGEPRADLRRQMFCIYRQISMLLSAKTITRFLRNRPGGDLRSLMSGSDFSLLDYVVHSCNSQPGAIFDSYQPLPMKKETRALINEKIVSFIAPCKNTLFTALFVGHELIHLGCQPRLMLDPVDLQTIMNFVGSSKALRSSRTWTPLCLPMFDDSSFVSGYIRSITETVTLVVISQSRDEFYTINECADSIVSFLETTKKLDEVMAPPRIEMSSLGIHSIIHFAFVATGYRQVIVSPFSTQGHKDDHLVQKRVYRAYKTLRANMRTVSPDIVSLSGNELGPHSFVYKTIGGETFVVWNSKMFELYVAFSTIKSKSQAVNACNIIVSHIIKNEETLFITSNPVLK